MSFYATGTRAVQGGLVDIALYLRTLTRDEHAALEGAFLARELMSPTLTLTTYRDILRVWSEAWAALESVIFTSTFGASCRSLLPPARAQWAEHDLMALEPHVPPGAVRHAYLGANMAPLSPAQSEAELLGMCYVAKGASLGAKVITRHLHHTLGLPSGVGTRFFGADAHDAMTWPEWTRELNMRSWSPEDKQAALDGATRAFAYLGRVFKAAEQIDKERWKPE